MNQMTKRIIIHVGPGKTGSSALQAWLCENRSLLSEYGVYYPSHGVAKNKISSGHIHDVLSSIDNKWNVDKEKINKLVDLFNTKKEHTLLLSSEFFFHNITSLHKAIPNAEFVAYIRNPVELLESNYNQGVKRHTYIQKFSAPKSLDNYFWKYLSNIFNTVPIEQIVLRPYHSELFYRDDIVSDILFYLGIKLDLANKKQVESVNLSYTFSALEYKRLMNHFPLDILKSELDAALQDCDIGLQSYSLMAPDHYLELKKQNIELMRVFIDQHKQTQLQALLEKFVSAQQKTPVNHQDINLTQLLAINTFIKNKYQPLYYKLLKLISLHSNLLIDNPIIYQAFGIETKNISVESDNFNQDLLKTANRFAIHDNNKPKVLNDLAEYFLAEGNLEQAFNFAKVAYQLSPKTATDKNRLNKILIVYNQQQAIVNNQNIIEGTIPLKHKIKDKVKTYMVKLVS